MAGKTGKAKLEAAVKRLFSATFDCDEPLPDTVTVKRSDLEAVLLSYKVRAEVGAVPNLHPQQR